MPTAVEEAAAIETIDPTGLKSTLAHADEATREAAQDLQNLSNSCTELPKHICRHSLTRLRIKPVTSSFLRSGLEFLGTQQSGRAVYDVSVSFKYVDLKESFLCGFLRISGLSEDHPTLTTYFEGEIIGSKYSFITRNPSWNSTEKIDIEHWARFSAFRPIAQNIQSARSSSKSGTSDAYISKAHDHVFMRWKELQILSNETPSDIGAVSAYVDRAAPISRRSGNARNLEGVSYAGFYYICLDQRNGAINGMYYHQNSELYQQLELSPEPHKVRQFGTFEWR